MENRVKPASVTIASRTAGFMPSVPRPRPSSLDMADDIHDATDVEYIMASIGFRRFLDHSGDDLISLTSHVPSSEMAPG